MKNRNFSISINDEGKVTFIYDDALAPLLNLGKAEIIRVSAVEPCEGGWEAKMIDGITLGPFHLRQEALDAEVTYLKERMF